MNHPRRVSFVLSLPSLTLALLLCACAAPNEQPNASMTEAPAPARSSAADSSAGTAGSPGIGDPLFPDAGNGGYDVLSYDLSIALERTDGPIEASATIRSKSTQALSRFDFDLHALEVRSIEVDGVAASFTRAGDELVITPAKAIAEGREFTTLVRYGGVPEGVLDPSFPVEMKLGWIAKDGEVYVVSEPTGAKSFYPCNDHPRDKALYTIRVTAPKPLMVVSNGKLAETIDGGDKRTFVYRPRDPIATYLVTIAIAEFEVSELAGPDGLTIRNYFSPKTKAGARKSFARTDAVIRFLGDTFGAYPFETCGNILASLDLPGALETQTLPTFGADAGGESIICHEQAHQWFGDTVSIENWQDIWLNEGFAEYASWMYMEANKGRERFEKRVWGEYGVYRAMEAGPARAADEGAAAIEPHAQPSEPPPGKPNVQSLFGASVYVRGPLALHALRTEVGDERFLALMRSWLQTHQNANASVGDFLEHVEKGSTPQARSIVEHWIFDEEMPHVAAWDEALAKEKAERDQLRKERDERRRKKKEAESVQDGETKKDG